MSDYLQRILKARVYDAAIETPLERAPRLSARLGTTVLFKREDLQPVFSFKIRGALNKIAHLSPAELDRGLICASAGNHAQGVALAAQRRDVRATVVMPVTTPSIKVEAVRELGADVILFGQSYDEAAAHAIALAEESGAVFVHPFDDPDVIAGQGTIGMEILRQHPDPIAALFVPVGGGGLISGIAAYVKALEPQTRIVAVEPESAASLHAALQAGRPVDLEQVGSFADGVAVRRIGDEPFRLCSQLVDECIQVSTDEICAAIRDVFEDTRAIVEPAGALGVAGLKKWHASHPDEGPLITINCGANVNFSRLRHIAERTDFGEGREALLAVEIAEQPGSFASFCRAIGQRHVTEFNYRYGDPDRARIFVGVELGADKAARQDLIDSLRRLDYPVLDLTANEMAKVHLRHMVGGRSQHVDDERVFRFLFPERRGALLDFLGAVGSRWNISLFHYRNHGSDYGRVLVGIQTPEQEQAELVEHLEQLGFAYWDESDNPAYEMFLG